MDYKKLYRITLLGLTAVVLTACGVKSTKHRVTATLSDGKPLPSGFVYKPGGDAVYKVVRHNTLPQWNKQNFAESLRAFRLGCEKLQVQKNWQEVCTRAVKIPYDNTKAKAFFEQYFTPWQVGDSKGFTGIITGYYEPVLSGDTRNTGKARFPIYGIPHNFVSVDLPSDITDSKGIISIRKINANRGVVDKKGTYSANLAQFSINKHTRVLKGRFSGKRFIPYYTRAQINGGALDNKAPVLGYAEDAVELFFLHIQGSGRLKTPKGYIRLGYADKNQHPYVSIGKYMAAKGYLPQGKTTMQGIKEYMRRNPQHLAEVLGKNPSYVFFRQLSDNNDGPIGTLGTPLVAQYAGAVDRQYITLGAPLFITTVHPTNNSVLNRLIMAQDTGGAINGAVRVDYFWGYGDEAGKIAERQKHPVSVWQLLPNGMKPEYHP